MNNFMEIKIIEDTNMINKIKRKFKERFFTLPWKPFQKFKTIPMKEVFYIKKEELYIAHPETARLLKLLKEKDIKI